MRKTPEFEACLAELIRLPSVSSIAAEYDQSNRAVIDVLAGYLDALNFDCEIMTLNAAPEKCNLIARRGAGNGGLVLSGHTDTVPCNAERWNTDPFELTGKDGNYYGLGTADMKSFFPIIFEALERLSDFKFEQPLVVVATADEESTMAGARALENKPLAPYCLIGEPTGLIPVHRHKGIIVETIRLDGKAGHSSAPDLGNNALEGMNAVINALTDWRTELQNERENPDFDGHVPTLNFGRIQGGDSANRICAWCELSIDFRLLPGMDLKVMKDKIHTVVRRAVSESGLTLSFSSRFDGVPPLNTSADSEIVKLSEKLSGSRAKTVAFCTEGPFFNDMGMETVILGPGDIDVAHRANEFLPIERIEPMINIVSKSITHFCGPGRDR